eukprot:6821859-Pyramimonas_sp.AAC.2
MDQSDARSAGIFSRGNNPTQGLMVAFGPISSRAAQGGVILEVYTAFGLGCAAESNLFVTFRTIALTRAPPQPMDSQTTWALDTSDGVPIL